MKTRNILIVFSILFLTANSLYGQDYYMYVDGKKHHYKVSPNKMLVHYSDSDVDSDEIRSSLQRMSVQTRDVAKIYDGVILIDFKSASEEKVIDLVEQWNNSVKKAYISPIVSGEDGFEMSFIPNQILVRVKQESDYSLLLQKLQPYHIKAIELCNFGTRTYLITLNDVMEKKSMQIANDYSNQAHSIMQNPIYFTL